MVCAYVALFAAAPARATPRPTATWRTGYIVTPTLPAGPRADAPRAGRAAPTADPVRAARSQEYAALQPALREADRAASSRWSRTLLDDAGINYLSVTGRAKSVASFAAKADRAVDGRPLYPDPLRDITDQIGVRVITYVHSDVAAVADLLDDQLAVLDDRDMGQETASEGRFGYASRHLLVALDPAASAAATSRCAAARQVQIRTVLQHAWAEFEHDIRYKGTIPEEHVPDLDRRFTLAAGLLELADREFSTIRDRLQAGAGRPARPRPTTTTRGSARRSSRPSWPGSTPTPAGRAPTTTPGSPGCCSSSASPRSTSSPSVLALGRQRGAQRADGLPLPARRRTPARRRAAGGRSATATSRLHGNAHRAALLRARLEKIRSPAPHPEG